MLVVRWPDIAVSAGGIFILFLWIGPAVDSNPPSKATVLEIAKLSATALNNTEVGLVSGSFLLPKAQRDNLDRAVAWQDLEHLLKLALLIFLAALFHCRARQLLKRALQ